MSNSVEHLELVILSPVEPAGCGGHDGDNIHARVRVYERAIVQISAEQAVAGSTAT
jgi:hypothetical protein